jgi:hypothetical protein
MMKGIEILSQSEIGCGLAINWTPIIIVTAIAAVVVFILIMKDIEPIDYKDWFAGIIITFMFTLV